MMSLRRGGVDERSRCAHPGSGAVAMVRPTLRSAARLPTRPCLVSCNALFCGRVRMGCKQPTDAHGLLCIIRVWTHDQVLLEEADPLSGLHPMEVLGIERGQRLTHHPQILPVATFRSLLVRRQVPVLAILKPIQVVRPG